MKILYLHGFKSSPNSLKATLFKESIQPFNHIKLITPYLPDNPDLVIPFLKQLLDNNCFNAVMGSSLGGYYATWIAERHDIKAVLINPVVYPETLLKEFIGWHTNPYSSAKFEITNNHLKYFKQLNITAIKRPENYQVFLQTNDEVLNYKLAEKMYTGAELIIKQNGNHEFKNFGQQIKKIHTFLKLSEKH